MVPFPITSIDPYSRFQGHGITIDAFDLWCAQLTGDLFAIAKFLVKQNMMMMMMIVMMMD